MDNVGNTFYDLIPWIKDLNFLNSILKKPEITDHSYTPVMLGDTTRNEIQTWFQALQIYFTASRGKVKFEKYGVLFLQLASSQVQFQTFTSSTLYAPKIVLKSPVKIFYD